MVMDYTTLFFAICSIAIGNVSGKLLAEGVRREQLDYDSSRIANINTVHHCVGMVLHG